MSPDDKARIEAFRRGLQPWRARRWVDASEAFAQAAAAGDEPAKIFEKRLDAFGDGPPSADWDAVSRMTTQQAGPHNPARDSFA